MMTGGHVEDTAAIPANGGMENVTGNGGIGGNRMMGGTRAASGTESP